MWRKVKQLLRGMKARSQETLLDAIGLALSCVTEADALKSKMQIKPDQETADGPVFGVLTNKQ